MTRFEIVVVCQGMFTILNNHTNWSDNRGTVGLLGAYASETPLRMKLMREEDVARLLQPVILGGDILAYSYVREFHRVYGIEKCVVVSTEDVKMLSSSRFTDYRLFPEAYEPERLYEKLEEIACELLTENPERILLLLGCNDNHASMLSAGKERLQAIGYVVPYIDYHLLDSISKKHCFYQICETLGIPYPQTWYYNCATGPEELRVDEFTYPLIAKPSDFAKWFTAEVEGKRKIYKIDSAKEMARVWKQIRTSNYDGTLVLQDFIPGEDDAIRSLTTFSSVDGAVRAVSGGRVCLQDHDPTALGNPVAILNERNDTIIDYAMRFLDFIEYRGFANFDIKYDYRDGQYKFFEINARAGRNTFYMSLGGVSFVTLIVDEFVLARDWTHTMESEYDGCIEAYRPFLYSIVPPYVLKRNMANKLLLVDALSALERTDESYPLDYRPDSLKHQFWAKVMYLNHIRKFKKFPEDTSSHRLKD